MNTFRSYKYINTRVEASASIVERIGAVVTQSSVPVDEDRANAVEVGEPEVVYHIDRKEVTKEE